MLSVAGASAVARRLGAFVLMGILAERKQYM
jgi:hypothetical protein